MKKQISKLIFCLSIISGFSLTNNSIYCAAVAKKPRTKVDMAINYLNALNHVATQVQGGIRSIPIAGETTVPYGEGRTVGEQMKKLQDFITIHKDAAEKFGVDIKLYNTFQNAAWTGQPKQIQDMIKLLQNLK